MEEVNHTRVSQFLLLGLSDDPELQPVLFGLFLSMYLVTVLGNLLIILVVSSDPHLHTPMYFFLSNLSFVDICFISTTVPKMLVNIQVQRKDISYIECFTQVYFLIIFIGMDNFLLSVMAFDRFVAICHPLNYTVIMNPRLCVLLVLMCWLIMFWISLIHILLVKRLTFSVGTEIPHFFCELTQLLDVASSDTHVNYVVMHVLSALLGVIPMAGILYSYSQIISSLLKMSSIVNKYKAFSTCGSHLCVVSLFYGTAFGVYLSSAATHASQRRLITSVMYSVITPMLNPFIYSLRNKDVKGTLGRLLSRASSDCGEDKASVAATGTESYLLTMCERLVRSGPWMDAQNDSATSQFLLLGLSEDPDLQPVLFGLFLSMYLVTVLGNLLIILAVSSDSHLHTPMYFFLSNLSFVDICFTSTTVPKMLVNIQAHSKGISYIECLTQVYFLIIFLGMDNFLLTVMAYDRFMAICHPLSYTVIMNLRFCGLLVLMSWLIMFLVSLIDILLMKRLTFSTGTKIPHFFCELAQILNAASSDTLINNIVMYILTALLGMIPMTGILFSYSQIVSSLIRMSSIASKYKAFSTCGSHLCVVSLFYGTVLGVYLSSAVTQASQGSSMASVMYTVVTPMLNPFIYSLRNKDVKGALGRLLSRGASSP
ncbi:uncharacterized protein ACOB7L_008452 [Callospermophilus lateralis]